MPLHNVLYLFVSRDKLACFEVTLKTVSQKNEKNRINPNKCDICALDIMVDFHWKSEANRWRSEICLPRSYADSLLSFLHEGLTIKKATNSGGCRLDHARGGVIVVLCCKKLRQFVVVGNIPIFIREMNEPVMAVRGKTGFTTYYTNWVAHVFKAFFYIVSFIYVKTNLDFWSRSYSKQPLLWPFYVINLYHCLLPLNITLI